MKKLLQQLAAYNTWAHQEIFAAILSLPEEKQKAELASSFSSLYKTILHMWDAESIWWQRVNLQEKIIVPGNHFRGSVQELVNGLMQQSNEWLEWVNGVEEKELEKTFHYKNLKGDPFSQELYLVVAHVFNHGTYHRGQLINMLRQIGVEKLPATDLIVWSRKK